MGGHLLQHRPERGSLLTVQQIQRGELPQGPVIGLALNLRPHQAPHAVLSRRAAEFGRVGDGGQTAAGSDVEQRRVGRGHLRQPYAGVCGHVIHNVALS